MAIEKLTPAIPIVTDIFKITTPQQDMNPAAIASMNLGIDNSYKPFPKMVAIMRKDVPIDPSKNKK